MMIKPSATNNLNRAASFKFQVSSFNLLFLVFLTVLSCNTSSPSEKRAKQASEARGDIVVGIVYSSTYSNFFLEGVTMAADEINQKGGISGRKIKTIVYDDKNDSDIGKKIAKKLAANDDVVAVVGHGNSDVAISASVIYEKEGIVFMSYGAKDPDLTRYSKGFTLRNIPDYNIFGQEIAKYVHSANFKKITVFYERSPVHRAFTEIFKKQADKLGIKITASRSYFKGEDEFKNVIYELKKKSEFDSVFITGSLPDVAVLIRQLREMNVDVPIIGGDSLDSPDLWATAGKAAENIVVPTVFYPRYPSKHTREFMKRFKSKYSLVPDTWAAQGYDALSALALAIEKNNGSAVPTDISNTIKFIAKEKEAGARVAGPYDFSPQGNIVGKEIFFKVMKEGEFVFPDQKMEYESDLFNYLEENTLRLPIKNVIPTIDPGLSTNSVSVEIAEQMFMGLTSLDPETYKIVPELAAEWTVDVSGEVYVFHIRRDAEWTNGKPVTAYDAVWAVRRNITSPYAHMLYILKNAKAINKGEIKNTSKIGVSALDAYTLIFELEYSASYFPALVSLMCYRPLPGEIIEKHGSRWTDPENIVTNGPYKPVLWEKSRGIFLKKNPGYYNAEKTAIPEIRYFVIPQSSLGLAMYENNELDIMGSSFLSLPSEEIARIKKDPVLKDEYYDYPHFCTYTYAFNTKRPPVDDPLVRKAVSAAIDRQLIIDAENKGNGEPATTCTRPPAFGFVPPDQGAGTRFDPFKAREWLAKAGYPDGKGFPEITLLYKSSDFHEKIAMAVQALLKHNLNINIKVREEDKHTYHSLIHLENPPHIFHSRICGDYPDADSWLNRFHPSEPVLQTGWKNQEFAELLDEAREESDPEQRKAYYRRAEQILCQEEVVAVPVYFEIYHSLVKSRIKGWQHMATGGQRIRDWYFKGSEK
ncbi:MAG: ABC transporter substrate-binding protein [Desulfobacteraceae bacterium]|nr:ABC transporter substrate-binding protein [Desulfobacteraceae bacterium]